jgi:O-antigen/teichoic acid export membrane protein
MSSLRAGGIVFIGVGLQNFGNYLFHLISARSLGPASYSDVATLTAVGAVLTLPLAGAQVFVARHVATAGALGGTLNDDGYVSAFGGAMLIAGSVLSLALVAVSPLIGSALSISSVPAVVFAVLLTAPSFLGPVLIGAAQGAHRFMLVAAAIGLPVLVRVGLAGIALGAGFGVAGVMAATLAATVFGLAIPLVALRSSLRPLAVWRPSMRRREVVALLPVVAGMLAVTCLTTDDVVAAKAAFTSHEAGLYGGASLIGRVILYLPVAIVTVLLPKVSARASAGHSTRSLLANSLAATAVVCIGITAIYSVAPHLIVRIAFGAKYQGAASLLWLFGIAMTLYALLNVVLVYRLGRGETRTSWLLLGGAIAQAAVYAFAHASPRTLLAVSIATAAVLLAASVGLPRFSASSSPPAPSAP